MSYRLIDSNAIAIKYPEVNEMPCVFADLPDGLNGQFIGVQPERLIAEIKIDGEELQRCIDEAVERIRNDTDEWCTDCSEYDSERHCCPRFNRVIREVVEEAKKDDWIPVSERLPEDSEYHLVTEYHMVSFARYWEHRWWDEFGDKAKFVTAWMPLPEPWEGEKDEVN